MPRNTELVAASSFADYELNLLEVAVDVLRREDFRPIKLAEGGMGGPRWGLNNVEVAVLREKLRRLRPEDQLTQRDLYVLSIGTMYLEEEIRDAKKNPQLADLAAQVASPVRRLDGKLWVFRGFDNEVNRAKLVA